MIYMYNIYSKKYFPPLKLFGSDELYMISPLKIGAVLTKVS